MLVVIPNDEIVPSQKWVETINGFIVTVTHPPSKHCTVFCSGYHIMHRYWCHSVHALNHQVCGILWHANLASLASFPGPKRGEEKGPDFSRSQRDRPNTFYSQAQKQICIFHPACTHHYMYMTSHIFLNKAGLDDIQATHCPGHNIPIYPLYTIYQALSCNFISQCMYAYNGLSPSTIIQPPDCILCMIWQSPSPGHPSAADEAWYWPKRILRSGWLCITSRPVL